MSSFVQLLVERLEIRHTRPKAVDERFVFRRGVLLRRLQAGDLE